MKRTVYHCGDQKPGGHLSLSIESACKKRDEWIRENQDRIGEVCEEDLIITSVGSDGSHVIATIKYTYYPVEE